MKKVLKLIAALGMISLMLSFVSCNLLTEAELIARNSETPGSVGSGTGGSGSGSGSGSSDTIGTSWGALFASTEHNSVDLQVWQGFDAEFDSEYGMKATVIGSQWFGGAIVQNSGPTPANSIYYDMSSVAKVTFKVKASKGMTIWAGYSNQNQTDSFVKQNINVTTDWQTITVTSPGVAKAWSIFAFGSDGSTNGAWVAFKDVTYFDASGKSLSLKYAQ